MEVKKSNIAVIGHGSNRNDLYDQIKKFSKDLNHSDIEKFLDEQYGINRTSISKLCMSLEQLLKPITTSLMDIGFMFDELGKMIKNSEKSRSILSKTIVLKKSSKKPYKIKRFKRFKNHR